MVYTGDTLIYGVQLDFYKAKKYIEKYNINNSSELDNTVNNDELSDSDGSNYSNDLNSYYDCEKIMDDFNLSIKLLKPPCCFFDYNDEEFSKVYIGVELCINNIVSRSNVNNFDTFEEYLNFYLNNISDAQKQLEINKDKYILDFNKILPNTEFQLKFYSLPNDCYSCT